MQLPQTAVQQNNVRTVLRCHPVETTGQNLLHHCKVVIGNFRIFDVKSAIAFLVKPFRRRNHHRPDSVAALNMRVVINFNPLRQPRQIKHPLHFFQIAFNRGFHCHFPVNRGIGIV